MKRYSCASQSNIRTFATPTLNDTNRHADGGVLKFIQLGRHDGWLVRTILPLLFVGDKIKCAIVGRLGAPKDTFRNLFWIRGAKARADERFFFVWWWCTRATNKKFRVRFTAVCQFVRYTTDGDSPNNEASTGANFQTAVQKVYSQQSPHPKVYFP